MYNENYANVDPQSSITYNNNLPSVIAYQDSILVT